MPNFNELLSSVQEVKQKSIKQKKISVSYFFLLYLYFKYF